MSRADVRASLLATLLFTAACTQQPAQIELKGQNNYGRGGSAAYAATTLAPVSSVSSGNAPSYRTPSYAGLAPAVGNGTQSAARIESIGVSDLAPPSKQAQAESFKLTPGKPKAPEPMVSEVKLTKDKTSAQLDRIVASDTAKPVKTASSGFIWPVGSKKLISGFGPNGPGKANDGINIASAEGEPVWAAADGEIVYAANELAGYGNMVIVKHANGKTTTYAHLSRMAADKYDRVKQGDIIGYVGSTGGVKVPQLHFAMRDGKDPVDPRKYLKRDVASN